MHCFIPASSLLTFTLAVFTAAVDPLSSVLSSAVEGLSQALPANDVQQALAQIKAKTSAIDAFARQATLGTPELLSPKEKASVACEISSILFPAGYVGPSSKGNYTEEEDVNWSTNCQLPAACFVKPTNTVQVAVYLKIITAIGSKFAVRNGGHNPNVGFGSVNETGILIDVSNLNTLNLSADRKVIQAGTGNNWGHVQEYLDPLQMSVVSGRYKTVGISGHILGGGYPIIPSLHGLASDNVKNFEIVLGNSSVVNANAAQHPDLFKVLKGGGNNFGIVTRFDLYTTSLHKLWYKAVTFNSTDYSKVLKATTEVQNNMEDDPNASLLFLAGFGAIKVTYIYAGWTATPALFDPLNSLDPVSVDTEETNGTVLDFINLGSAPEPPANRLPIGLTSLVDAELYEDIYKDFLGLQQYSNSTGTGLVINIQPFGQAAVRASKARGGNILGNQAIAQNWWSALVQWNNPADATVSTNALINMRDAIQAESAKRNQALPYIFANDGAYFQNVMASYGAENLALMKSVSARYDPGQIFQTLQNGGWFVRNA